MASAVEDKRIGPADLPGERMDTVSGAICGDAIGIIKALEKVVGAVALH